MNVILSNKDIFLLMNILGAESLIGISNPFLQHSKEDMEKEWERTFKKLHNLGFVDFVESELKFDKTFIHSMWVMARTNVIVETMTDDLDKSLLYFNKEAVTECKRLEEEQYLVLVHGTPEWTWNHVLLPRMLMGQENLPIRSTDTLLITPDDYKVYCERCEIHNPEELSKNNELKSNSLIVRQFNKSIQRKKYSKRMMMFYRLNKCWNVEGLHVLASPSYNWTLKMVNRNGQEWLEAKQGTSKDILKEVLDVIKCVKQEQPVK
ncbi:hypothetical protein [Bacillus sp. FJAT-47783]|uniref:hypothetical protein n=1 Tax=Bacillus sp. FJAT-47783 TaxID=2922712 RepID=UPI001FAD6B6D|nr:hypothetical protein [Bacillus sp. FJAT-47783]